MLKSPVNDKKEKPEYRNTRCDLYLPPITCLPAMLWSMKGCKLNPSSARYRMVKLGGIGTIAISYYNLGYQTGAMADELLKGADISLMPIQTQKEYEYVINKTMCDAIGVAIPDDLLPYVITMEE